MALARAVRVVRLGASTRRVLTPCALTCFEVLVRYGAGPSLRSVCWCRCPFVFAFGSPLPADPTRPITSFKTAWIKVRQKAGVKGRWHGSRHTLVTELAESGAGDEVIMSIAGHVSRAM